MKIPIKFIPAKTEIASFIKSLLLICLLSLIVVTGVQIAEISSMSNSIGAQTISTKNILPNGEIEEADTELNIEKEILSQEAAQVEPTKTQPTEQKVVAKKKVVKKPDIDLTKPAATTDLEKSSNLVFANKLRSELTKPALKPDSTLDLRAQAYADSLADTCDDLVHSDISLLQNIALSTGSSGWSAGENLAFNSTIQEGLISLKESPGHYANMINDGFEIMGVGVSKSSHSGCDGRIYIVQMFTDFVAG